jgi:hypothetical protein
MKNHNLKALRRRIGQEREHAGTQRVRYSDGLKRDVLALLALPEWSRDGLAKALGLAPSVVYRWSDRRRHSEARIAAQKRSGLRRVEVVQEARSETAGTLELELSCGAKVRGLTVEQLARLLEVRT